MKREQYKVRNYDDVWQMTCGRFHFKPEIWCYVTKAL